MLAADGQLTQLIRSLQSSPLPIGSFTRNCSADGVPPHVLSALESLTDDMDTDECVDRPLREQGNVLDSLH